MPAENILLKVGCQLWVASNTMDNFTAELNQRLASCQKETPSKCCKGLTVYTSCRRYVQRCGLRGVRKPHELRRPAMAAASLGLKGAK